MSLWVPLGYEFLRLDLFWAPGQLWELVRYFVKRPSVWVCLTPLSRLDWAATFLGGRWQRQRLMLVTSGHTIHTFTTADITLDRLAWGGMGQASPLNSCSLSSCFHWLPWGSDGKDCVSNAGGMGSIPGQGTKIAVWPKKKGRKLTRWGHTEGVGSYALPSWVQFVHTDDLEFFSSSTFILFISLLIILSYYNTFKFYLWVTYVIIIV